MVTRDELRKRVWPGNTFVDFDNGLNVAIAKLRHALDDRAEKPAYIETMPRIGYRFVATVESLAPTPGAPATPLVINPPARRSRKLLVWSLTASLLTAGLALLLCREAHPHRCFSGRANGLRWRSWDFAI